MRASAGNFLSLSTAFITTGRGNQLKKRGNFGTKGNVHSLSLLDEAWAELVHFNLHSRSFVPLVYLLLVPASSRVPLAGSFLLNWCILQMAAALQ